MTGRRRLRAEQEGLMTDPTRRADERDDYDRESAPPLPAWVKALAIAIALVVLAVVALMLLGGHTIPAH
jgi:hypothetical protein